MCHPSYRCDNAQETIFTCCIPNYHSLLFARFLNNFYQDKNRNNIPVQSFFIKCVGCFSSRFSPIFKWCAFIALYRRTTNGRCFKPSRYSVCPHHSSRKSALWTNAGQDWNFQRSLSAIGPYEFRGKFIWTNHWSIPFPGKFVWTNGSESSSKVSPRLVLVHGWLFPASSSFIQSRECASSVQPFVELLRWIFKSKQEWISTIQIRNFDS